MAFAALVLAPPPARADRNILWNLISRKCAFDQQKHGNPAPCDEVDLSHGIAVLKDNSRSKPHAFLVIPTSRVPGIESPELLLPDAPNYFGHAWAAASRVAAVVGKPLARDMVGLAVNSAADRTQDQLHIHVDCIRPEIRDALRNSEAALGTQRSELSLGAPDHPYMTMKLAAETIDGAQTRSGWWPMESRV